MSKRAVKRNYHVKGNTTIIYKQFWLLHKTRILSGFMIIMISTNILDSQIFSQCKRLIQVPFQFGKWNYFFRQNIKNSVHKIFIYKSTPFYSIQFVHVLLNTLSQPPSEINDRLDKTTNKCKWGWKWNPRNWNNMSGNRTRPTKFVQCRQLNKRVKGYGYHILDTRSLYFAPYLTSYTIFVILIAFCCVDKIFHKKYKVYVFRIVLQQDAIEI